MRNKKRITKDIVHVSTSDCCNNNCIFCMESTRLPKPTIEEVRNILHEKKDIKEVAFTSGEPTLNQDLCKYIRIAKSLGYKVNIITNGRRLSYLNYCKKILNSGVDKIMVSLHGNNSLIHESNTRTRGSFSQTLKGLKNLSSLSKQYNLNLETNITVTRLNKEFLKEIYLLLSNLKIDTLNFNCMEPNGNANQNFSLIGVKYTEIVLAYQELKNFITKNSNGNNRIKLSGLPYCFSIDMARPDIAHMKGKEGYEVDNLEDGKVKCPHNNSCMHGIICEGVWERYIEEYGWEEFEAK